MNILVVGQGGREHALAWKIARSPLAARIVSAPGNPGMAELGDIEPVRATDVAGQVALAQRIAADLVVVGPEAALEVGLADALARVGIPCFGASAAAARIETSKAFMKGFARRHGLPTADFDAVESLEAAKNAIERRKPPYVVKADGLAAGKGVVIVDTQAEALDAARAMLGKPGAKVVIEEFMTGEEVSLFVLSDGRTTIPFGSAQDHKRAFDGDAGPNTGGMGTYAPAPAFTASLEGEALSAIAEPAILGLAAENAPYRGALYAGLMLTPAGVRLVEFNARFGDPETQVLMMRLESDIVPYLMACATGGLDRLAAPRWSTDAAICVVLAARGYPGSPLGGTRIGLPGGDLGEGVTVFHAGTALHDGALVAAGGRVLNVCARAPTLGQARERAYAAIARIDWPESFHRSDIGWRALSVSSQSG